MEHIFKISKRGIIAILTLCMLFGIVGTCINAAAMAAEATVVAEEHTQELVPMMASNCRYNHYEVTSSWPNGNVQTVTYWVVDAQGNRVGTQTWTSNYPESGDGAMGAYGTPGGFAGCHCPNCG